MRSTTLTILALLLLSALLSAAAKPAGAKNSTTSVLIRQQPRFQEVCSDLAPFKRDATRNEECHTKNGFPSHECACVIPTACVCGGQQLPVSSRAGERAVAAACGCHPERVGVRGARWDEKANLPNAVAE